MIHELKTEPLYFKSTAEGIKNFEVRKNDRKYCPNDYVALNEWENGKYTGRCTLHKIVFVLSDSRYCKEGYVVLGIEPCEINEIIRKNPLCIPSTSAPIYKR